MTTPDNCQAPPLSDEFEAKAREIAAAIQRDLQGWGWVGVEAVIASALREAVEAEREACANAAWSEGMKYGVLCMEAREAGSLCARAIRARTEPQEATKASDPTL